MRLRTHTCTHTCTQSPSRVVSTKPTDTMKQQMSTSVWRMSPPGVIDPFDLENDFMDTQSKEDSANIEHFISIDRSSP